MGLAKQSKVCSITGEKVKEWYMTDLHLDSAGDMYNPWSIHKSLSCRGDL